MTPAERRELMATVTRLNKEIAVESFTKNPTALYLILEDMEELCRKLTIGRLQIINAQVAESVSN